MRHLLSIFTDPFTADEAEPISDTEALSLWQTVLAGVALAVSVVAAGDAVRRYHSKGQNWATFLLARLTVGGCIFQAVNLTSVCLALWPYKIAVRLMWFIVPLGSTANLSTNLWRLNVFRYDRLPKQWISAFQMNNLVPYLLSAAYICCWPIYSWIFEEDRFSEKDLYKMWASWGFVAWLGIFGFLDLFGAVVALYKVTEYKRDGFFWNKLCIFLCIALMIACDIYLAIEVIYLATKSAFPYKRIDIAPLFSLAIFHLGISYLYLMCIVRYTLHMIPVLDSATSQGAIINSVGLVDDPDANLPKQNAAGMEFAALIHENTSEDQKRRALFEEKKKRAAEEKKEEKIDENKEAKPAEDKKADPEAPKEPSAAAVPDFHI